MGINTDLSQPPYFDDFNEEKQFNRVLFKPARAVQTRELNQLQAILQNQVERFGSNIYKEGTIISGVNITQLDDLFYVKLNDSSGSFEDPTAFNPSEGIKYFVTDNGLETPLRAEIIQAQNGFETRDPDLKTFYILYTNTGIDSNGEEVKQFLKNSQLTITDNFGNDQAFTVTVANVEAHAGRSFGVQCNEGVIYQKGHFIFVDDQFAIISKYSNTPNDVAVGFTISENIIDAALDNTLYDNAQGFNNFVAPGADRLQLKPVLSVYGVDDEPDEFFSLIRFENGAPIQIRNVTQFNSIATEMATRTYEESGNYTIRGLRASLEQETVGDTTTTYASVSQGKAYIEGYAVETFAPKYLTIDPVEDTALKAGQLTGVEYGSYYEFDCTGDSTLNDFSVDGTRYDLKNSGSTVIGQCSIRSIERDASGKGRIFVYNIYKYSTARTDHVAMIEDTPITSRLIQSFGGVNIYDSGKRNIKGLTVDGFIRRSTLTFNTVDSNSDNYTKTITRDNERVPVDDITRIFAVNTVNEIIIPESTLVLTDGSLSITFPTGDDPIKRVYYDEERTGIVADSLEQVDAWVRSTINANSLQYGPGVVALGMPNVIELLQVIEIKADGEEVDRTSSFNLFTNAKDGFYDHSYIQLKPNVAQDDVPSDVSVIAVQVKALKRNSTVGSGFLTSVSYETVDKSIIQPYEPRNGKVYDLMTSIDFRPYVNAIVRYQPSKSTADTIQNDLLANKTIVAGVSPARDTLIESTQEFYLSRFDRIVLDGQGRFSVVKGNADEIPSLPVTKGKFVVAEVFVPGKDMLLTGTNALRISTKGTRNYTMKDIEGIDKRLTSLTEIVSLNLLEQKTKDLFIPNEFGYNRFKNGILADNFKSFEIADMQDNEYRSAIDRNQGINMPAVKQFPLEMEAIASSNYEKYDSVITLPATGQNTSFIAQRFATRSRNAVSNYYKYNGTVYIDPEFDAGYNVTENPDVNLDIDLVTPFTAFIEELQEFIPITTSSVAAVTTSSSWQRVPGRAPNGRPLREVTTTQSVTTTETGIGVDTQLEEQSVGSFVTDVAFQPYMRSREIRIVATGLRPNTYHHLFFNEDLQDENFYPASIRSSLARSPRNVRVAGKPSTKGVRTDSRGNLNAVFKLPENTYYVGEGEIFITDVNQYSEKDSAATSFGKKAYRAYSFDIEKTALTATTRTPEFAAFNEVTTTQSVTTRVEWYDPLAQTFYVKKEAAKNADCLYLKEIDLYFRGQDATNSTMADVTDKGVNIEIREVQNGYPSATILPFGKKHLEPSEILVSEDASVATGIVFDDPIRLNVEKEYAFVVRPDANDPNYLVWTAKVGGVDATSNRSVTHDWGDGVLFTSTNNRAWKSYQDEDIKFDLKRAEFESTGQVTFRPKSVEFFGITSPVGAFQDDELAYVLTGTTYSGGIDGDNPSIINVAIQNSQAFAILQGDWVRVRRGTAPNEDIFFAKVEEVVSGTAERQVTLDIAPQWTTTSATISLDLLHAGRVSYFNSGRPDRLYIHDSAARSGNYFQVGNNIVGETTGATAQISAINDVPLSYFQPNFYTDNSTNTRSSFSLLEGNLVDKEIADNQSVYMASNKRTVYSQSNIANGTHADQDFKVLAKMTNNGVSTVTPILDNDLKLINAYQYQIADQESTTSRYVAKEVVLQDGMGAVGLKVLLTAFRPPGANIEAWARFRYPTDVENYSSWIELTPANQRVYSNISNVNDYREFEYNLNENLPSQTVNWSAIHDDMIGVVSGAITTGAYFNWLTESVGSPAYSRMDINNDGSRTSEDATLLRAYGLTNSIPEANQTWIETHIKDVLDAIDPTATDLSDVETALAARYITSIPADDEFNSFQVKLVYKNDPGVDINVFPHVRDFRAIALT